MANSRFSYVRQYELPDPLLPGTFLVVRLDGKGFHRFSDAHHFEKPNDRRALELMNAAAKRTMESETLRSHILLAFGESDEFSFLLDAKSELFGRRNSKILSTILSIFTMSYALLWPRYFPNDPLNPDLEGPSFDGRVITYPSEKEAIDYFKWRQADTHINNLYNTTFWALIQQGGMSAKEAHAALSVSATSAARILRLARRSRTSRPVLHTGISIGREERDPVLPFPYQLQQARSDVPKGQYLVVAGRRCRREEARQGKDCRNRPRGSTERLLVE